MSLPRHTTTRAVYQPVHLSKACVDSEPFEHFRLNGAMDTPMADRLLEWLENEAQWELRTIEGFYETYDASIGSHKMYDDLEVLRSPQVLRYLRSEMERLFNIELSEQVELMAQKMSPGFRMGIHSDFGEIGHVCRLIFHLGRDRAATDGGLLLLLDSETPNDISIRQRFIVPSHGGGVGFKISRLSYHAVSTVVRGDRYSLAYSFFAKR